MSECALSVLLDLFLHIIVTLYLFVQQLTVFALCFHFNTGNEDDDGAAAATSDSCRDDAEGLRITILAYVFVY